MKKFIEVTDQDRGLKVLVPIGKITGIVCDGTGDVFIEMGTNRDSVDGTEISSGILCAESYEEIKAKIEQSDG